MNFTHLKLLDSKIFNAQTERMETLLTVEYDGADSIVTDNGMLSESFS